MRFSILMIALWLCSTVFAETTNDTPTVKTSAPSVIGQRYVRDYILVPVRSGQSEAHRILHRGIRSGTKVDLLETNNETGYSQIRLSGGIVGWIQNQYLQEEPTAEVRLQEANRKISRLSSVSGSTGEKLLELENENQSLKKDLEQTRIALENTQKELEHIQSISANAIAMSEENQLLLKESENIKNQRDTLKADNHRLSESLKRSDFMNGVIAVILGIIATLVIQYFYRSRKRTEWA